MKNIDRNVSFHLLVLISFTLFIGCGGGNSGDGNNPPPSANDNTPPIISIIGDNPLTLPFGSDFIDPGATAIDDIDGNLTVIATGIVDNNTIGNYTIEYSASDAAGNNASGSRTVNVVPARVANMSCVPPEPVGGETGEITIQASFANLPVLSAPMAMVQPATDSSFWFVALRAGQVVSFDNQPQVSQIETRLDISAKVSTFSEQGLTGLTIHPNYPQDNRIFVVYSDSTNGGRSTIASFVVNTTSRLIDPNSEQVLLTLDQPAGNHNGGDIAFGPDEMLYVAFGDGGQNNDTAQQLTNLWGSMIRIDVSVLPYQIPVDNPFNNSQATCETGSRLQGDNTTCPEIYAYGFRNPWRWSFDRQTGDLWVADVGESTFEEVDKVIAGGNYGWPIMEANICFAGQNCDTNGLELPITQYPRTVGVSTVGGYVYRGTEYESMQGLYIWGDTFSSQFLSIPASSNQGAAYTPIFNSNRLIAAMAEGNNGDIYLLNLDGGAGDGIYKVVAIDDGTGNVVLPDNLSEVGCIDTQTQQSSSGVFDFDINAWLWSDGAFKRRALALPDGEVIQILEDGDFLFPTNSILIKHFLNGDTYLETRLLINHASGWTGYSYEWNDQQTDAVLLSAGKTKDVGDFVHTFPSTSQCAICHTSAANFSLGIESAQLNLATAELGMNQLDFLSQAGYLDTNLAGENQPALSALEDETASLSDRARSYLHSNCSGCHRPGSNAGFMDFRFSTLLADTAACDVPPELGDFGVDDARIISPGNADASVLVLRMETLASERMPPLATLSQDTRATELIRNWINALTGCN